MITAIHNATVFVNNQDKALEFYTTKLGFTVVTDLPMGPGARWLEVAPPDARSRILLYKATAENPGAESVEAAQARVGTFQTILLATDSVQKTYEELSAKGVNFPTPAKQEAWGMWAVLADQDGNQFGLTEVP